MKYQSTRGNVKNMTFEEALLSGYLSDAGICVPEAIPKVDKETLKCWSTLSYQDLVKRLLGLFVSEDELPVETISELVDKALGKFSIPEIVKVSNLEGNLNVLELFHGPTLAFKDLAMSCVGQLLEYFLNKRNKHITVIVGTSGDTGSAAIDSVKGSKFIDLVVLLPRGRTAKLQELQMTTVIEDNIHVYRVDGTSDDLDVPIKNVFLEPELRKKHNLCSINSINWGRILVQIAHHFYAYFQVQPNCEGTAEIVIPTGACGNLTSGVIAKQMGLPVRFVCTVNSNDIVARTVEKGDFSKAPQVVRTLAPAMDIQIPYNVERLVYIYSGGNAEVVKKVIQAMETTGESSIPENILHKFKTDISSDVVDDEGIKSAMERCWNENSYLLCPHTATAAKYHYDHKESTVPRICIATASPAKFDEAVVAAGLKPQPNASIKELLLKPTKYTDMEKSEDWTQILKNKLEEICNEHLKP